MLSMPMLKKLSTPLEARGKFTYNEGSDRVNVTHFRSLIGSLGYLTHTRPALLYSVGILSRYMEKPSQEHLNAVKHEIRYVKGIADYGLFYKKGELNSKLIGFNDSNFVGDISDRKSTSGHIFFLGGMTVSCSSQKQSIVAMSSCEAEYVAATAAACQALWMKCLISELKCEEQMTVKLMVDNQPTIKLRTQSTTTKPNTSIRCITSFDNVLKIRKSNFALFGQRIN